MFDCVLQREFAQVCLGFVIKTSGTVENKGICVTYTPQKVRMGRF